MEAILASKLECSTSSQQGMPVTPLSFLRVMSAVSRAAAARLEVLFFNIMLTLLLMLILVLLLMLFLVLSLMLMLIYAGDSFATSGASATSSAPVGDLGVRLVHPQVPALRARPRPPLH